MSKSVADLIDELGGPAAIAKALPISDGAVRQWKHKRVIPRGQWPDLIDRFPDKLSIAVLREVEANEAA